MKAAPPATAIRNRSVAGAGSTAAGSTGGATAIDGADDASHLACRPQQVIDQGIDRGFHLAPGPAGEAQAQALAGELDQATATFERAVAAISDVGLLAEEVDVRSGEMIGNFPQAFSHIGLVNAAWAISQAQLRAARRDPVAVGSPGAAQGHRS